MARLDAHHLRIGVAVFGSLILATLSTVPGQADTATQLAQEQAHLKQVQADLDHLTAAYDAEQARYARTQTQLGQLKDQQAVVEAKMARLRSQLGAKAREAYETGGAGTIDMLLSAGSFAQFADRVEYLSRTAQSDSDLLLQAANTRQELLRSQRAVTAASASGGTGTAASNDDAGLGGVDSNNELSRGTLNVDTSNASTLVEHLLDGGAELKILDQEGRVVAVGVPA